MSFCHEFYLWVTNAWREGRAEKSYRALIHPVHSFLVAQSFVAPSTADQAWMQRNAT